jgi:hypothetical protein
MPTTPFTDSHFFSVLLADKPYVAGLPWRLISLHDNLKETAGKVGIDRDQLII